MQTRNIMRRALLVLLVAIGLVIAVLVIVLGIALEDPAYEDLEIETISGERISSENQRSWWNPETLLDLAVFKIGNALYPDQAYFRDGVESVDFRTHVAAVRLSPVAWNEEGLYEVEAQTLEGPMDPAFRVYSWHSNTAPTLIFHHGASEVPFDGIFEAIFERDSRGQLPSVNLIIVRTPYHQTGRLELLEGAATMSRFLALMAVCVRLDQKLIGVLRARGVESIGVAGISLGGFITNRHHLVFNSADFYVPIVAGTDHAAVLTNAYPAAPDALLQSETLRKHLDLSGQWARSAHANVFPILGRYDGVCRLEEQGPSYGEMPVKIWNRGHISAALSFRALRHVLLRRLAENP